MAMAFKLDGAKNYKGPEIDLIIRLANKPAIVLYLLQETWDSHNREKRSFLLRYNNMHKLHNYISSSLHSQSMSPAHNAGGQSRMQQWVCLTDGNPKIMKPQSFIMICKQTCSINYPNGEHVFIKEQTVLPILSLYFKAVPYAAPLKVIQKKNFKGCQCPYFSRSLLAGFDEIRDTMNRNIKKAADCIVWMNVEHWG